MMSTLKKILAVSLLFMCVGCGKNDLPKEEQTTPTPTTTPTETIEPIVEPTLVPTIEPVEDWNFGKAPINLQNLSMVSDLFEEHFSAYPTTVKIFIGDGNDIGFIYEYCVEGLTEEDSLAEVPKDEWGNRYLYYAEVTQLTENVFSSSGTFIPSWKKYEDYVKEGVDFYFIRDGEKIYFVFEEMSLDELENYTSEVYSTYKYIESK